MAEGPQQDLKCGREIELNSKCNMKKWESVAKKQGRGFSGGKLQRENLRDERKPHRDLDKGRLG